MEIKAIADNIARVKADAILINIFEGTKKLSGDIAAIDSALDEGISQLISRGEIKGKLGEITVIHSLGKLPAVRMVVLGLGKKNKLTLDRMRGAVAEACRHLQKKRVNSIATLTHGSGISGITSDSSAQAIVEAALLGTYSFRRHITKKDKHGKISRLTLLCRNKADVSKLQQAINRGSIIAEAAILARDMANEPSNFMSPSDMAEAAKKLAKDYGLEFTVLEREQMQEKGMGALLGVAQGSCQPPKLILLNYKGKQAKGIDLALVGKGITFDSGGISLKPSHKMEEMKGDMAGGAAVIAAISAMARLKLKINVTAIVPAVENLPGNCAFKPGDVLKAMTGKTIEIISTDAEGRLILADALGYASKLKARFIIDVATLTGACVVALGYVCTGAMGNNQGLVDKVITAGAGAGELIWQLPMYDDYKEQNKSDIADIKNAGSRGAGTITAALFLAEFVGKTPWLHLDIAGTSTSDKEHKYLAKGATGVPVRTLVNLALAVASR